MVQNCMASVRWSMLLLLFMISNFSSWGQCLMVPATLEKRVDESSLVVEAKVVRQHATWNKSNSMIYTTHELEVYKVFKGIINTSTVVIATEGGIVGMDKIEVNPELKLTIGQTGIFTLKLSSIDLNLRSPLFTAVEAAQGFIKYNRAFNKATGVFESYNNIADELYRPIQQLTNTAYVEKMQLPTISQSQNSSRSLVPVISGFSPTTVTAGTKTTITINGTGFGATQGTGEVSFRDAGASSGFVQPIASEYVSWSDTEIIVEVMSGAGTGKIEVSDGTTTITSAADLTVTYNISNVENGGNTYTAIHTNDNAFGGYTFQYHTEIAAVSGATADMESALDSWACETGINWRIGFNTTADSSERDGINIVRFDNGAELPSTTIGRCRTYSSGCTTMGVTTWYVSELDMTFNDDYTFHYGAGLPGGGEMDFLSIALHELGHGHQLGHVINASMIMHYSISAGDQKRTLAADEISAGIYMSGLGTATSHCNRPVMEANGCGIAPVALFNAGAAASCAGSLTFDFWDVSENLPTSWAWDVDGNGSTDYTTRNPSHTYASAGNYTVELTATNSSGSNIYTSSVAVGTTPVAACTVSTTNTGNFGTGVDGFIFNTIQNNHIDSDNDGTQDFTCDHSTVLVTDGSYPFTVNLRGGNLEFCQIYIDYNNDGSFNTSEELVYDGTTAQAIHTGTIIVPSSVTTQTSLRLRIVTDITATPTACGPTLHGEAEDYGVYILCGLPIPDVATLLDVTGQCTATAIAPTATDPCDASTITGTTTDPVTYTADGTYTITWTYAGISGSVTQTQTVIIDDTDAPVPDVAILTDLTHDCEVTIGAFPTATDVCEGTITATTTDPLFYNTQGTFTITWTYDDDNGNPITQTQTVIVDDITAPVPDLANLPDIADECMATAFPPQATDNCNGPIFGTTTDPTTFNTEGTHTVTWTFTDAAGNMSTQIQTVIIDDVTDPIINCVFDINETADVNCQFTIPDYTGHFFLLDDACSTTITVSQDPIIGSVITGTAVITLTADDGNGNTSTCTFNVVIADTEAPTVVTQDITVSLDGIGNATIAAKDLDNASTDNCSTISFSASQTTFDCTNLGDNTVALTGTDGNLNAASENATVTVLDDIAPVADVAVLADVTGTCSATATAPTATDNCDGTVTASTTDPTTYSVEGTYTISWDYTDVSSNTSSQDQTVIVDDVAAPTIIPDADITVSANAACEFTLLDYTTNHTTLTDDCSAAITVTQSPTAGTLIVGTTEITLTADDENGNQSIAMFFVVIDDTEAPVVLTQNITVSLDGTGNATIIADELNNGSTDNCSTITFSASQTTFDCTNLGDNTVALTVTDANLNAASENVTVTVVDDLAPVADVAVLADINEPCSATATAPTATDNCDGAVTASTSDPTTYSVDGTYTITWTYTDGIGNTSSQDQTIIVADNIDPVITCNGDITVTPAANCEFTLIDYSTNVSALSDNCGTVNVTQSPAIGAIVNSNTVITLTADDGNGNTATCTFNLLVEDTEAPTVICRDIEVNIEADGDVNISQSTLDDGSFDNCSGLTFSTGETHFDCTELGTNFVVFTATDANGNSETCTSIVTVLDKLAPAPDVMSLNPIQADCDVTITNFPTAFDNCSGVVTATTADPLTYNVPGTYVINWTYTDGSGNDSTQIQSVIINDTVDPIITCNGDITETPTANCEFTLVDYSTHVSALSDNCGTATVTQLPVIGTVINGPTLVTLTAEDDNGNTATCSFMVLIEDTEAPTVFCKNIEVNIEADGDVDISQSTLDDGSFDNCTGLTFTTSKTHFDCTEIGPNTVIFTATDANGNSETCTSIVTVLDKLGPAPDVMLLNTIEADCEVTITDFPTAFDNCSGAVVGTTTDPLTYNVQGTYEITWTYTDASGNPTTQVQTVIINDLTAPVPDAATLTAVTGSCEATIVNIPTATDECFGVINGTTTDPLTYTAQGTHTVTWTYEDANGNSVTQEQTVVITDTDAPVADAVDLATINAACGAEITVFPTATDACAGAITGTTTDPLSYFSEGSFTITWNYDDGNGNTSMQTQLVNISGLPEASETVNACNEYEFNGTVYTLSQTITEVVNNPDGCDTLYTIELIIDDYFTDDIVVEACGTYLAPSGTFVYDVSGIYMDTVSSMTGCDTVFTIDLTIIPGLPYEYDRSACGTYTAPDGSIISSSGMYTFNVPGPGGCDSMITVNLTIIDNPNIAVAVQGDSLISAEATAGVTYQWIDCQSNSIIPGATEQVFTPNITGEYQVLLNIDGCMAISECYEVVIVGTNELLISDQIKVYPNPFFQDVNIEFGQLLNDVEVSVFDAAGKLVHQQLVINSDKYILDSDELSGGIYFLQLKSKDEIYRSKLIKFNK